MFSSSLSENPFFKALAIAKMKIRLLNASHLLIGYLGILAGYTYVHEVMADSLFQPLRWRARRANSSGLRNS